MAETEQQKAEALAFEADGRARWATSREERAHWLREAARLRHVASDDYDPLAEYDEIVRRAEQQPFTREA